MNELSTYPKEETAYEWFRRVQQNKRKISLNPIAFPPFHETSASTDTASILGNPSYQDYGDQSSSLPSQFNVTDQNIINLSAQTFQGRYGKLNELHCRCQRWRRRRRNANANTNATRERLTKLEDLLLDSFPRGTGLTFIDKILATNANNTNAYTNTKTNISNANADTRNKSDISLEIVGRTGMAKTKILLCLAANYAAATSTACLRLKRRNGANTNTDANIITGTLAHHDDDDGPPIIIFDPEHAVDFEELVGLIRVAVLRRWNATSEFRQCLHTIRKLQIETETDSLAQQPSDLNPNGDEYTDIERDIQRALGRIHIVRPRDIANGYVSALESLNQALNQRKGERVINSTVVVEPPVMLLLDSALSAFQLVTKMQEDLPNGSGLSGLNDFMRQLKRLRSQHSTIVMSTRAVTGKGRYSANFDGVAMNQISRTNSDKWDKMTTHRLMVVRSVLGSPEERKGYDFVALLKPQYESSRNEKNTMDQRVQQIFPFSCTANGISCRK